MDLVNITDRAKWACGPRAQAHLTLHVYKETTLIYSTFPSDKYTHTTTVHLFPLLFFSLKSENPNSHSLPLVYYPKAPYALHIFSTLALFNLVFALQVLQVQTLTLNTIHHTHLPLQIDERPTTTPPPWRWQRQDRELDSERGPTADSHISGGVGWCRVAARVRE
ncbi:hypothetical protein Hanom_Chr01g00083191 [Helianthus anomalus]